MITIEEARQRILTRLCATGPEIVALAHSWGRVTAAPVLARLTQPPQDVSAMDGYAVRAAEAATGSKLRLAGQSAAGHPWGGVLGPGEAVRVFTGAVMPRAADSVLLQEDAQSDGANIIAREDLSEGRHVRRAGQDFTAGDVLLPAGRVLSARDVGLAAAANHPWLAVHRRPRVAILATGDEIALPGEPIPPGGIVSSNTHMLSAMVRMAGGDSCLLPIVPDDRAALAAALDEAAHFDLLLTSGGASVGDHDLVREVLLSLGMELNFWRVAMRPGKPLLHGILRGRPVIGLPGNPVSAMVTALQFVCPAVQRLSGLPGDPPATHGAVCAVALQANDARADHLRARLDSREDGSLHVIPFPHQDSNMLAYLARSNALLLRSPHAPALAAFSPVSVIRLDLQGI